MLYIIITAFVSFVISGKCMDNMHAVVVLIWQSPKVVNILAKESHKVARQLCN